MNRILAIEGHIENEYSNLKKSINNAKLLETVIQKEQLIDNLFQEYKDLLKLHRKQFEQVGTWNERYDSYEVIKTRVEICKKLLATSKISTRSSKVKFKTIAKTVVILNRFRPYIVNSSTKIKFRTVAKLIILLNRFLKMAEFDIKTATALVHPYDGSTEGLEAFIDSASLLNELTAATHKQLAAKFLRTRLNGKARLGLPETANTIELIIDNVKQRCQEKISPDSIIAKMKAIKQKQSVQTFCEELESLTSKLESVYLDSKIPDDVASSMASKAGVDALINGVNNSDTKLILRAGNFANFRDAVLKVMENSVPSASSAEVFTFSSRGRNLNNGFHRNNNRRNFQRNVPRDFQGLAQNRNGRNSNYSRNFNDNYSRNFNDNRNRNYDNRNNIRNHNYDNLNGNRNFYNHNRHYDNNGRNFGNRNRDRNVYYAENDQSSSARPQTETSECTGVAHPRA